MNVSIITYKIVNLKLFLTLWKLYSHMLFILYQIIYYIVILILNYHFEFFKIMFVIG